MADERNGESSSSQQNSGGETTNNRWPPHSFYVLNYSFTLPTPAGEQQPQQQEGPRMTLPIFGPAGGVFVMNHNSQQQTGTQAPQRGEGPMEGVEFGFEINNPQDAGGQHPFANLFGHTHKPRASERAIAKLRELCEDELGEGETACPICFDKYDLVKREDLRNNDEDDPPVSVPANSSSGRQSHVQEAHVTIENEDPEESVPDQDDPAESVPMDEDQDPETSVPETTTTGRDETEDPETSVPEATGGRDEDPPESVPESGQQSDHRPVELPCGHRFGQSCIKEWLGSSNTCPLCRTPLESQDEYLRSTGQEPEGGSRFGSGILDFIFQQVPDVFNIIRREVYNNNGNNNNNTSNDNDSNNNNDDASTHSNDNEPPGTNTHNTNSHTPRPFHVHIVRDEDGVYRTHTHHHQRDSDEQPQEGSGEQEARHTFISGNTMSELLRAFTTPPPGGSGENQQQQQGFPFRISRIFNTALNTNNRNRESRHHPYTRTANSSEDSDNRDLQCASLPLSLCVGDSENEPIIRLDCGHGYHDGCLRMAMRAHGDGHMVDTNDVWCTCCRRYQTIIN